MQSNDSPGIPDKEWTSDFPDHPSRLFLSKSTQKAKNKTTTTTKIMWLTLIVINRLSMPKHVDHLSRSTGVHLAIGRTSSIRSPPSAICPSLRSHWLPAVGLLQLLACGHHNVMCPSFSLALSRWTAAAPCLWPSPCDTMYPLRTIQNHLASFSFAK